MPYTNAWSVTVPAGTEAANTIDDHLRRLRLDIQERMNSIVADWAADPVVLNATTFPVIMKRALFTSTAAVGSKATLYGNLAKILSFSGVSTLDIASDTVIDIDEFNAPLGEAAGYYDVANLVGAYCVEARVSADPIYPKFAVINFVDTVANSIGFKWWEADGGGEVNAGEIVHFLATLLFKA